MAKVDTTASRAAAYRQMAESVWGSFCRLNMGELPILDRRFSIAKQQMVGCRYSIVD
jgi:hypothetical protein